MAHVKIWLHCVWSTNNSTCIIPVSFRPSLLNHFRENAKENNIVLDTINAHVDHVHTLINLGKLQNLSTLIQYLKGESAFWMNSQKILPYHCSWQDDYFAVSISHSHVDRVREYIQNQDQHHKNMNWEEEAELFMKRYGFEQIQG